MPEKGTEMTADLGQCMKRDGVALARGVFDLATAAKLEADFDLTVAQLADSGEDINARWESAARYEGAEAQSVVHTHNVQNFSAVWLQALQDNRFLDAVEQVIGPDIVLHHSKLFQKPPGEGAPFPMHQDWRYFPTENDTMIAAVIHLSAATDEMGCIRAYPRSHELGRLESTSGRIEWDDPDAYTSFIAQYSTEGATPYEAEPGDVLFFTYKTIHGSGPNVSDQTRKTVLVQLFSGTDRLEQSDHAVSGLVLRGRNYRATRRSVNPSAA